MFHENAAADDDAPWEEGIDTSTSASVVVDENGALGTNGYVARMIQDTVGGDIHMILAEEPYPADFDAVVSENHQETSLQQGRKHGAV